MLQLDEDCTNQYPIISANFATTCTHQRGKASLQIPRPEDLDGVNTGSFQYVPGKAVLL